MKRSTKDPLSSPRMVFTTDRLSLPLFMVSRNSLNKQGLEKYIDKKSALYITNWKNENTAENLTKQHFKHLAGADKSRVARTCAAIHFEQASRNMDSSKPWQLPPNMYNIDENKSNKPCYGALWKKLPTTKLQRPSKASHRFYDIPSFVDLLFHKSNKHKGVFLTNPRERRPTARSMIHNTLTCFRDPDFPSPATYDPYKKDIKCYRRIADKQPDQFYRHTTVPIKTMSLYEKNSSFTPGPGSYENRFRVFCGCSSKLIYTPGLREKIDKQKRLKFRMQPYQKMRVSAYYTPEWRHVHGHGFRRLFKGHVIPKTAVGRPMKSRRKRDLMQADGRYIRMINAPRRTQYMTSRLPTMSLKQKPIQFNCIVRPKARKQLRVNKKLAFGSGSERFKDAERTVTSLTPSQLESVINSLPLDRQFRDHPVMRVPKEEIVSNLFKLPAHYKPTVKQEKIKRLFKFSKLPKPKILVSEKDIDLLGPNGEKLECRGYYDIDINPRDFFRGDAEEELLKQYNVLISKGKI